MRNGRRNCKIQYRMWSLGEMGRKHREGQEGNTKKIGM
jgi:hypothetical protein